MVKTALGGRGLWSHCLTDAPKLSKTAGSNESSADGESGSKSVSEEKWEQEDLKVLSILHSSLSPSILEAYSYCESAKDLWSTLNKIYGNISNISRVFKIKKSINILSLLDEEFTAHLGKFRALWSELEMLRPQSVDPEVLIERREQDKVFGLGWAHQGEVLDTESKPQTCRVQVNRAHGGSRDQLGSLVCKQTS
ncbi:hypothetical protein YC2023_004436 [Brassica napus]